MPWLAESESVLGDHLDDDALVMLVEPRRLRDRAKDIRDEEADLASTLAKTWGAIEDGQEEEEFPRLHLPFDRMLTNTDAPIWTMTVVPDNPDVSVMSASGWDSPLGDPPPLVTQLRYLMRDGFRIVVGADGAGTAPRLAVLLSAHGIDLPVLDKLGEDSGIVVAPLERGAVFTNSKLAVLTESDVTGRRLSLIHI